QLPRLSASGGRPAQADQADQRPRPDGAALGGGAAAGAGTAGGGGELRGVQGLQRHDEPVGLRREPARPARLSAAEGDVRAALVGVPAAGAGSRGAGAARPAGGGAVMGAVADSSNRRPGAAVPRPAGGTGA